MNTSTAIDLHTRKIGAVINTASGSCDENSADELKEIFTESGHTLARVWCGSSDELPGAFAEVEKTNIDVLVVLGGDGTIRSAAGLCTATGPLLLPLPGGTMNILPKALYGDHSWQDILRNVLANPSVKTVSGGTVEGERFYISAICGAPALWANAREALREKDLGEAVKHGKVALDHMFASKITYHFNEMNEGTAEALTVTCPLISETLDENRKVFEAAVIDVNHAGELLELFTAAAFGQWRDSKNVATISTSQVTVSSEQNIPIIVDGETINAGREAHIEFVPEAFLALVPANEILP